MAKLKPEDLIAEIKAYTGDRTDDDSLKIIEDVSDSVTPDVDAVDWEGKYNDLAKKYKDRFTGASDDATDDSEEDESTESEDEETDEAEDITVDDLFKDED